MKLGPAKLIIVVSVVIISLMSGGCAYLKVQREAREKLRGPMMKTDLVAEMPNVVDKRSWEEGTWETPNYNVRIFAREITNQLRQDLAGTNLFTALPSAGSPEAEDAAMRLQVVVTAFNVEPAGSNAYRVPQVIANGALLPAYAVTNVATKGQVDMSAYVLPSTNIATNFRADVQLIDKKRNLIIINRSYQSRIKLGSVSQREMMTGSEEVGYSGVSIGRAHGQQSITDMADLVARDASWKLIPEYTQIAIAHGAARRGAGLENKAKSAYKLLGLLKPVNYLADEVKLLHDELFDDKVRASLFNDYRARALGLESADELPADQVMTVQKANDLLDDASLFDDLAVDAMDRSILQYCVGVMLPPVKKTKAKTVLAQKGPNSTNAPLLANNRDNSLMRQDSTLQLDKLQQQEASPPYAAVPPEEEQAAEDEAAAEDDATMAQPGQLAAKAPAEPANAPEIRAAVTDALVQKLKDNILLQNMMLDIADKAIGPQWPAMKNLLVQLDSPATRQYLAKRQ